MATTKANTTTSAFDKARDRIAKLLGETEPVPLRTIRDLLELWGEKRVTALAKEAVVVDSEGGLFFKKGKRRRTLGGVFFFLARQQVEQHEKRIFGTKYKGGPPGKATTPPKPPSKPLKWSAMPPLFGAALKKPIGEVNSSKIALVAKPGPVVPYSDAVVLVMLETGKVPSIPKGLPAPEKPTKYAVFIAKKQWRKIESALQDPKDALVIDGVPTFHESFPGITVLAKSATSRKMAAAKRKAAG